MKRVVLFFAVLAVPYACGPKEPLATTAAPHADPSASASASASAAVSQVEAAIGSTSVAVASASAPASGAPKPEEDDLGTNVADLGNKLETKAQKQKALDAAKVKEGDLALASGKKIAGPCWKAARHAAIVRDAAYENGNLAPMMDHKHDIDGDGKPDHVFFMGAAGMTSDFEVYVRRGECAYWSGA